MDVSSQQHAQFGMDKELIDWFIFKVTSVPHIVYTAFPIGIPNIMAVQINSANTIIKTGWI
jgi:hypothetical protein